MTLTEWAARTPGCQMALCAKKELGLLRYWWGRVTGRIVYGGLYPGDWGFVTPRENGTWK